MANIVIGNTGETYPVEITGDVEFSILPKAAVGKPHGSYEVLAKEGWNISNNGLEYLPERTTEGLWFPEQQADQDVKVTNASGLTKTVKPCDGKQFEPGKYTVEVA